MQQALKEFVDRRCTRSVAIIMGVSEREIFPALTPAQQRKLRAVVRDTLYDFRTVVTDLLEGLDTGEVVLNELWLEKLEQIHRAVVADQAPAEAQSPGYRTPSEFGGGRPIGAR